jgi:hypothetical protein
LIGTGIGFVKKGKKGEIESAGFLESMLDGAMLDDVGLTLDNIESRELL